MCIVKFTTVLSISITWLYFYALYSAVQFHEYLNTRLYTCTQVLVQGLYVVRVRVNSYSNPSNFCTDCSRGRGCCDDWEESYCGGGLRCDTYFQYCLRPLGSPQTDKNCQGHPQITSSTAMDGGIINFAHSMVLGHSNPFFLNSSDTMWMVRLVPSMYA